MTSHERPEIVWEDGDEEMTTVFDDIPQHTELTIHVAEKGEGETYVEYLREDGTVRRLLTQKGGGELRITTSQHR